MGLKARREERREARQENRAERKENREERREKIKEGIKHVGESGFNAVVGTAKGTVEDLKDAGKGVKEAVKCVGQGDLKGAMMAGVGVLSDVAKVGLVVAAPMVMVKVDFVGEVIGGKAERFISDFTDRGIDSVADTANYAVHSAFTCVEATNATLKSLAKKDFAGVAANGVKAVMSGMDVVSIVSCPVANAAGAFVEGAVGGQAGYYLGIAASVAGGAGTLNKAVAKDMFMEVALEGAMNHAPGSVGMALEVGMGLADGMPSGSKKGAGAPGGAGASSKKDSEVDSKKDSEVDSKKDSEVDSKKDSEEDSKELNAEAALNTLSLGAASAATIGMANGWVTGGDSLLDLFVKQAREQREANKRLNESDSLQDSVVTVGGSDSPGNQLSHSP